MSVHHRYSIVAWVPLGTHRIMDWLNYCRAIGFDHIFLYFREDNELQQQLLPYSMGNAPFVTCQVSERQSEKLMYQHFISHIRHLTEWAAFLGPDDFLRIRHPTIGDFIKYFNNEPDVIYFNRCIFGNNGFEIPPAGSVLVNYTQRYDGFFDSTYKHIVRTSSVRPALFDRYGEIEGSKYLINIRELKHFNVVGDDVCNIYKSRPLAIAYLEMPGRFELFLSHGIVNCYPFRSREEFFLISSRSITETLSRQTEIEDARRSGQIEKLILRFNEIEDLDLAIFWKRYIDRGLQASRLLL